MLVFRGGKQIHEEHTLYIPSHLLIRYLEETCTQSATKPDVLRDMFFSNTKVGSLGKCCSACFVLALISCLQEAKMHTDMVSNGSQTTGRRNQMCFSKPHAGTLGSPFFWGEDVRKILVSPKTIGWCHGVY